jgi:hypothetical protein
MWIPCQSIVAQQVQVVKFPLHTLIGRIQLRVPIASKELTHNLHLTMPLLVTIHLIAAMHTKDTKSSRNATLPDLWQDIMLQVLMEWVVRGQMPYIVP